jgi:hypothetical protein
MHISTPGNTRRISGYTGVPRDTLYPEVLRCTPNTEIHWDTPGKSCITLATLGYTEGGTSARMHCNGNSRAYTPCPHDGTAMATRLHTSLSAGKRCNDNLPARLSAPSLSAIVMALPPTSPHPPPSAAYMAEPLNLHPRAHRRGGPSAHGPELCRKGRPASGPPVGRGATIHCNSHCVRLWCVCVCVCVLPDTEANRSRNRHCTKWA